jgi:Animal haem peroxidase
MTTHGGGPPRQSRLLRNSVVTTAPKKFGVIGGPKNVPGFRHFLHTPGAGQAFDPVRPPVPPSPPALSKLQRLQARMQGLSKRMTTDPSVSGLSALTGARDNPAIPSGYTYLLQFMAHDLVATAVPFWAAVDPTVGTRNERMSRLRLETLYGSGPTVNPAPYAPDNALDTSRTKLRLGRMAGTTTPTTACPFRDLARAAVTGTSGLERAGLSEPLIADGRNDDSVILAQLTVLFQALHNAVVDVIKPPNGDAVPEPVQSANRRFACARAATTLIYRTIIRNDLLPRILHLDVLELYDRADPIFLDQEFKDKPSGPLPLEFSHGAFRFGHAMVRSAYQLNKANSVSLNGVLNQTSTHNPRGMPLDATWLINWSQFFETGATAPPNLSQLIGPTVSQGLMDLGLFGPIDDSRWFGLPYRDLTSGALAGLWSVDALIAAIGSQNPTLIAALPNLTRSPAARTRLVTWLSQAPGVTGLAAEDIAALADDPPLPFYILFEAEDQMAGKRLGPLGSIIVAEILYAILADKPLEVPSGANLVDQLGQLSMLFYCDDRLTKLGNIDTMPALIAFVAASTGWKSVLPAFV